MHPISCKHFECCCVFILARENTWQCGIWYRIESAAGSLSECRLGQNCFVITTQQNLGMVCLSVVIRTLAGILCWFRCVATQAVRLAQLGWAQLKYQLFACIYGSWGSMRLLLLLLLKLTNYWKDFRYIQTVNASVANKRVFLFGC